MTHSVFRLVRIINPSEANHIIAKIISQNNRPGFQDDTMRKRLRAINIDTQWQRNLFEAALIVLKRFGGKEAWCCLEGSGDEL